MASSRTKQCRGLMWLFTILHVLLLVGPFCYFVPCAFVEGTNGGKVVMSLGLVIAMILLVFSIMSDIKHRAGLHKSVIWILVGAVMSCISIDIAFIWTMVAVSLTDELLVCPLKDYYKSALIANKEIDKRG